mmetsp:Transcript_5702/g.12844  ORF Transcript_5702/g.12844 Transcript_5702/m.12844 type:complete len:110 (+) Transcript_5702:185-514(+)
MKVISLWLDDTLATVQQKFQTTAPLMFLGPAWSKKGLAARVTPEMADDLAPILTGRPLNTGGTFEPTGVDRDWVPDLLLTALAEAEVPWTNAEQSTALQEDGQVGHQSP